MRILFLGDIVGRPGRRGLAAGLPRIRRDLALDAILANAENASGGLGLAPDQAEEIYQAGVDVLTSGNHISRHKEIYSFIEEVDWLLRPGNYPQGAPGKGLTVFQAASGHRIAVINIMGRTFMHDPAADCPFKSADRLLSSLDPSITVRIVDFHAETTSEKRAMGYYLAGRVTAVLGTHTHVQTFDAEIMSGHTGYITDLGMCGPADSILGLEPEAIIARFTTGLPQRFQVAKGRVKLEGVLLNIDENTGKTLEISPWREYA